MWKSALVVCVVVAAAASAARADDGVSGTYDIKIDEMANNCSPAPVALQQKTLRVDVKSSSLSVDIETIPMMSGNASKNGRISAKTAKVMPTTVGGLDGKYSIAGHSNDKGLELVLVAEYSRSDTKKPYCTQSWTITGKKSTGAPAAPSK